jgi:hypothetical protein
MLIEGVERHDLGVCSHFPVLAAAVARTTGPVLECGMGDFSTPMLHGLCRNRTLASLETDSSWMERFSELRSPDHEFHLLGDGAKSADVGAVSDLWRKADIIGRHQWSVALLDNWPGEVRYEIALRLKGRCKFIVCHDAEEEFKPADHPSNFQWKKLRGVFKYQWFWKKYLPYTMVLSDEEEFAL